MPVIQEENWMRMTEVGKRLKISRPTLVQLIKRLGVEVRNGEVDRRERYVDLNEVRRRLRKGSHKNF